MNTENVFGSKDEKSKTCRGRWVLKGTLACWFVFMYLLPLQKRNARNTRFKQMVLTLPEETKLGCLFTFFIHLPYSPLSPEDSQERT